MSYLYLLANLSLFQVYGGALVPALSRDPKLCRSGVLGLAGAGGS